MPRYHFHTLNGRLFRDMEGEDLADDAAARRKALMIMGEVLRDGGIDLWGADPFRVLCIDAAGSVVTGLVAQEMPAGAAARILANLELEASDG